jgi:hypothetical protein
VILKINGQFLKDRDAEYLTGSGFGYRGDENCWVRELKSHPTALEATSLYFLIQRLADTGYEVRITL